MSTSKYNSVDQLPDLSGSVISVDTGTKKITTYKSVDDLPIIKKKVSSNVAGTDQNISSNPFLNAQKPTSQITNQQVQQAQQHINSLSQQSTEQKQASGTPFQREILVDNVGQYNKDQINKAAENNATEYFKNNLPLLKSANEIKTDNNISLKNAPTKEDEFSLKNLKNISIYQKKVAEIKQAFNNGDLALTQYQSGDKAGEPVFTRPAKFIRGIGQGIENSFEQTKDAFMNMTHSDKGFADYLDNKIKNLPAIPEEAPTGIGNEIGQQIGGLIKPVTEFSVGAGLTSEAGGIGGFAALASDLIPSTTTAKTKELYYQRMSELYDKYGDNIPEEERMKALKDARSDAPLQAIPDEAMQMYLFGRGGSLDGIPQTGLNAFKNSLQKAGVDIPKMALTGAAAESASEGIKNLQGYDTKDATKKVSEALENWAVMETAFKVAHGIVNVPKYLKASANETILQLPTDIRQQLNSEAIAKGWITNEQLQQSEADLNQYEKIRNTLPADLSHEKAAAVTGLLQKNENLEEEKKSVNTILHDDIDAEIDNNTTKAKQILNSNQPLRHETDNLTGQRGQDVGGRPTTEEKTKAQTEIPIKEGDVITEPTIKSTDESSKKQEDVGEVIQPQQEQKINTTDYRGEHQLTEIKTNASNLENGGTGFDWKYVAQDHDLNDKSTKESYRVLKNIKDNPDAEITIYRSVPKDIDKINEGDWVTLSKNYATEHGMDAKDEGKDAPVISMKVKAKDIAWDGNDLNEFVYHPEKQTPIEEQQPEEQQKINSPINKEQDASTIREDTRRVSEEGGIPEGSQDNGSQDLQRGITQERPESTEVDQPGTRNQEENNFTGENEEVGIHSEKPTFVLTHKGLQELATEVGLEDVTPRERQSRLRQLKDANDLIDKWKNDGTYTENVNDIIKRASEGKIDEVEQKVLANHIATLREQFEKIGKTKSVHSQEFKDKFEEIQQAKQAAQVMRSKAGGLLGDRSIGIPDDTLEGFLEQEKDLNKGAPLTDNQITTAVNEHSKIEAATNEYKKKFEELQADYAKLLAERELKKTQATTKKNIKKTHEDFVKERGDIVNDIREKLKKARQQTNVTVVPYANELIAIAPDVAKLAKSLIEEGVTKLEDVVKNIHSQLKEDVPDIQEKDVHDIIAGVYNEKKKTRSEVAEQMQNLRIQAQLVNKYEAILKGEQPKTEKDKIKFNQDLHELRQKIKGLEKEEKEANTFYREEKSTEIKQLEALKKRNETELKKVQEQLKSGDFSKEEKTPLLKDPELKKNFPKTFKETQDARDRLLKAKEERTLRMLKNEYANETKLHKVRRIAEEAINVGRVAKSSFDVSMPFRQGLWGLARQLLTVPIQFKEGKLEYTNFRAQKQLAQEFGKMYQALASEKIYRRIMADIHESPRFELAKEAGLSIAEPDSPMRKMREEVYGPSTIEKVPVLGKSIPIGKEGKRIGGFVKASERAATVFVNQMKWNIFNDFVDTFQRNGQTLENAKDTYKAAADYANQAVGRGKLKINDKYDLERANAITSKIFFSLRLQASRLQLMTNLFNPLFYAKAPKEVRTAYLKDVAKFTVLGMTTLAIAKQMGLSVNLNPYSTDFGKIKVGNTTYDVWGGFAQWAVFISRMVGGKKIDTHNKLKDLDTGKETEGTVAGRFMRSKLSPEAGFLVDMLNHKDYVGNPVTLGSEAKSFITPLQYSDMQQLLKDDPSLQQAIITYILMAHGLGVNTYGGQQSSSSTPSRISRPERPSRPERAHVGR